MSKWSHLPNAGHIAWVIRDVKENPRDWETAYLAVCDDAAWYAARDAASDAAWGAASDAAWGAAWFAAWDAAWFAAWGAIRIAARDAIRALVAYDHAGALFDIPVEQVRVQAYLGQPAAILMLPACQVRDKRRELVSS